MARHKTVDIPRAVSPPPPASSSATEPAEARNGKKRISLPLRENGSIDREAVRAPSKERLRTALSIDRDYFADLGAGIEGEISPATGPLKEEHVQILLSLYEQGIQWGIPQYLKGQTKGTFVIPQPIAEKCFRFSIEKKSELSVKGALFLNSSLPSWMLEWFAKAGPGADFIGGIAIATWCMTQAAVAETKEWMARNTVDGQYGSQGPQVKPNGHAGDQGVSIPVEEGAA